MPCIITWDKGPSVEVHQDNMGHLALPLLDWGIGTLDKAFGRG